MRVVNKKIDLKKVIDLPFNHSVADGAATTASEKLPLTEFPRKVSIRQEGRPCPANMDFTMQAILVVLKPSRDFSTEKSIMLFTLKFTATKAE